MVYCRIEMINKLRGISKMDKQIVGGAASCGAVCTNDAEVKVYPSLAMVYIPQQRFRDLYDHDIGLCRGTIFRELDKPFTMRRTPSASGYNNMNGCDRRR